jgi:uncharacterized protein (TIGR02147 family)
MNLFEFTNYKDFVRKKLKTLPKNGHGQYLRIAKLLGIHTTMVTHIFKGDSNLSIEQALKLAEHFVFTPLETDYFVTLVQSERASNTQSRRYFSEQLTTLKTRALNLTERLHVKKSLDERDQPIFYSAWYYSGIRLLTAIHDFKSTEAIAEMIDLPHATVARAMEFLLSTGLVVQKNGKFSIGETLTYVSRDSRLVSKHHLNWRLKAIQQLDYVPDEDLVFTNSIALSASDFQKIREELVKFLEKYKEIGDPSPAEQLCFLTLDWRTLRVK